MKRITQFGVMFLSVWALAAEVLAAEVVDASDRYAWYASIDDRKLPVDEYGRRLVETARGKFFHGRIPDNQFENFRRQVADELLDEHLLAGEAQVRGLVVDDGELDARWLAFDQANSGVEGWAEVRDRFELALKSDWRRESLALRLRELVRGEVAVSEEQVRSYYQEHPELFTEPAAHIASIILLKVDPSASEPVWQEALLRGAELLEQVQSEADFAEMAALHSEHESSARKGELGVVHRGMLAEEVEAELARMEPGQVSKPLRVLEGVALVRLKSRVPEKHHPFEAVQRRAEALYLREQRELAEASLVFDLRQRVAVELNLEVVVPEIPGR